MKTHDRSILGPEEDTAFAIVEGGVAPEDGDLSSTTNPGSLTPAYRSRVPKVWGTYRWPADPRGINAGWIRGGTGQGPGGRALTSTF